MKDFEGKIAFITGGASGAGFGQAQIFSEAGMKVVIADIRQDHMDNAAAHFKGTGAPVHFIKLDVMDRDGWAAAADETEKVFGTTPDLLIMTAGVNVPGPVEASTYDDFDWIIGVNFGGVVNGLVTFAPRMIKAGRGGHIAATVSMGAFGAAPMVAPYTAAKAAALNILECYYQALKPYGIAVSAFMPANIKSNIHESALKNRPAHFAETGYNVTEQTADYHYTGMHIYGTEPRVLAERFKKGLEDEIFLIVPYKNGARMVELDLQRFPLMTSIEGTEELERRRAGPPTDEQKALFFEKENFEWDAVRSPVSREEIGFGMAKKELDWIAEEKRAK